MCAGRCAQPIIEKRRKKQKKGRKPSPNNVRARACVCVMNKNGEQENEKKRTLDTRNENRRRRRKKRYYYDTWQAINYSTLMHIWTLEVYFFFSFFGSNLFGRASNKLCSMLAGPGMSFHCFPKFRVPAFDTRWYDCEFNFYTAFAIPVCPTITLSWPNYGDRKT